MLFARSMRVWIKTGVAVGLSATLLLVIWSMVSGLNAIRKNGTTPLTGSSLGGGWPEMTNLAQQLINPTPTANSNTWRSGVATRQASATSLKTDAPPAIRRAPAFPPPTQTPDPARLSPKFQSFISQVKNGESNLLRGVYVEGVISLPVLQQPENDIAFVSLEDGTTTQFRSAAAAGVTGLLAHNFLSGGKFYDLSLGQEVRLVYGDGSFHSYRIEGIYQYQKLSPNNLQSDLVDLSSGKTVSTNEVFTRFYRGGNHVTFQTCLERDGLSNWGLSFWIAMPLDTLH